MPEGSSFARRMRVLVVDDDPAAAELTSIFLADTYDVEVAATAMRAVKLFETFRPDLVVLDIHLSEVADGVDVFQEMRRHYGKAPAAIFLSASEEADTAGSALGVAVLRKPVTRQALTELVGRILTDQTSAPRAP